jgi:glycosyltransferase involved in cell wall biosynthesis
MKILYLVHQFFPQHVGGTEMYVRGLAQRAQARGDSVCVLTHVDGAASAAASMRTTRVGTLDVIELHSNYSRSPRPGRDEYADPGNGALIARLLREQRPDIVHVAHTMKLGAEGMRHCEALGIPVVVTLCDYWFLCPRHTLLRSDGQLCEGPAHLNDCQRCLRDTHPEAMFQIYARPTGMLTAPLHRMLQRHDQTRRLPYLRARLLASRTIVALSEFTRQRFVAYGIPPEHIRVLPHGLEALPDTPPAAAPPELHIVFIGSLVPHKGAHVLLEALRQLPGLPLRCTFYGALRDGDAYQDALRRDAEQDPRVVFAGLFPPEDIWRVLDEASVLALPSLWYENEPLVVKAALHRGVPVLTSALGSLAEQVRDGRDGWLLPPGDATALAQLLAQIATQPSAWRVQPTPDLGMDTHARHIFDLYERIISDVR